MTLIDGFGRVHRDLRISLRCTYCMPADGVPWLPSSTMLSADEIVRVAQVAVSLGVSGIRLTGGEPLLRADVVDVVRRLARLEGPEGHPDVSLTTNALRLPALASPLREAGLARVNISIDTRAVPGAHPARPADRHPRRESQQPRRPASRRSSSTP